MTARATVIEADAVIENHGSLFLLQPLTAWADSWIAENIDTKAAQFFGGALVVEHRYIRDIIAGMSRDGLVIE